MVKGEILRDYAIISLQSNLRYAHNLWVQSGKSETYIGTLAAVKSVLFKLVF